jgi:hypothetical protein
MHITTKYHDIIKKEIREAGFFQFNIEPPSIEDVFNYLFDNNGE